MVNSCLVKIFLIMKNTLIITMMVTALGCISCQQQQQQQDMPVRVLSVKK